jgi:hypothetical protein
VTSIRLAIAATAVGAVVFAGAGFAQTPAPAKPAAPAAEHGPPPPPPPPRPSLFFVEAWRQNPKADEQPLNLITSVRNPDLELKLYGPGAALLVQGKDGDDNNPSHVWSGDSKGPFVFTFRHKKNFADLTVLGRIRVNTKVSGFHRAYPVVKLADGTFWIGDRAAGAGYRDWTLGEINLPDVHWTKLDIATVTTKGNPVDKLDLSKVDEIGFADLMPGSGHGPGGWIDVAQIEVYGKPVAR